MSIQLSPCINTLPSMGAWKMILDITINYKLFVDYTEKKIEILPMGHCHLEKGRSHC